MDKRILIVTILVLCLVGPASATNWSVDGRGEADNDFYPLMQAQQNYVREENFRNGIHDACLIQV